MRTVLLVAATLGVLAAFAAIGDTFLIVFIGIFLALVFEYPVRYLMAKTGMSRGLAATVTVLGTALAVLVLALLLPRAARRRRARLPPGPPAMVEQLRESDELSWLGDSGAAENVQTGASRSRRRCRTRSRPCSASRATSSPSSSSRFTIIFICIFLLSDIANLKRALGERAHAGRGRALARTCGSA